MLNEEYQNVIIVSKTDIANAQADVIVNSSNGVGYMGGKRSIKKRCRGVAESLNYYTKGEIEREAMQKARRFPFVSSWICGTAKGGYFITGPHRLDCKCVFHAVTMSKPASRSSYQTVKKTLDHLGTFLNDNDYRTVALPMLGCGNGALDPKHVLHMIQEFAKDFPLITFYVYLGAD